MQLFDHWDGGEGIVGVVDEAVRDAGRRRRRQPPGRRRRLGRRPNERHFGTARWRGEIAVTLVWGFELLYYKHSVSWVEGVC